MTFEQSLNRFGELCCETQGASFTISKLKSNGDWKVNFVQVDHSFIGKELPQIIALAETWLLKKRKSMADRYTLFYE